MAESEETAMAESEETIPLPLGSFNYTMDESVTKRSFYACPVTGDVLQAVGRRVVPMTSVRGIAHARRRAAMEPKKASIHITKCWLT